MDSTGERADEFLDAFLDYDKKYYYHVKQTRDDRIKHTQDNATCRILFRKALAERGNDKPEKTPFIRSFGHEKYLNTILGPEYSNRQNGYPISKSEPSGKRKKPDPYKPSKAKRDACYVNIGNDSPVQHISKARLKVTRRAPNRWGPHSSTISALSDGRQGEQFTKEIGGSFTANGDWVYAKPQFIILGEGREKPIKSFKRGKKNVKRLLDRLKPTIDPINYPRDWHMYVHDIKARANPGGDTGAIFGSKEKAFYPACATAMEVWKRMHAKVAPSEALFSTGGREKPNLNKEHGEVIMSRCVMQEDYVMNLTAAPVASAIEDAIKRSPSCPIKIGKSSTGVGYLGLLNNCNLYQFGIEFDWSKWDVRTRRDKSIEAFSVIRSLVPAGEGWTNYCLNQCSQFIDKYVVTPDEELWKVQRGVPSGSRWTSLVNSIIHALILEECIHSYRFFKDLLMSYQVTGDDGLLFSDHASILKFRPAPFVKWCRDKFGGIIEILAHGPCISENPDESLSFNKLVLFRDEDRIKVTVKPDLLCTRNICPTKKQNTTRRVVDQVLGSQDRPVNHMPSRIHVASQLAYATLHSIENYQTEAEYQRLLAANLKAVNIRFDEIANSPTRPEFYLAPPDPTKINGFKMTENISKTEIERFKENWLYDNMCPKVWNDKKPRRKSRRWYLDNVSRERKHVKLVHQLTNKDYKKLRRLGHGSSELAIARNYAGIYTKEMYLGKA
jgi:hypothetical protein